jgi:hypothetical protein
LFRRTNSPYYPMNWPCSSVQEPSSHSRTQIALLKLNPLSVQLSSAVVGP